MQLIPVNGYSAMWGPGHVQLTKGNDRGTGKDTIVKLEFHRTHALCALSPVIELS